ncbi:right-handed parallel beta-helix repeat-containing protein [Bacillus sp. WMMC1349]|uniref:right-handed parallel beta-helix repeat-containing protein n=1 Tax=Bacillus sp. WMMC1349 TaxID=2736254 RepID=UPI00155268C1|nr:right-handed parallel beta-helix repeat-containing protein [Bacillus sp. WMMC1349]NPC91513.1 right-handed parallel beta-helix repeat-containing protein [Bacillus sp. WMMC1349]
MTMVIVDVRIFGAVGDGKTDSTQQINECLRWTKSMGYNTVWIPNGTYLIDGTFNGDPNFPYKNAGINVPSNITILMDAETMIKIKPNSSWGYSAFYIGTESNIKISGGTLIGDRDEHIYTPSPRPTHEWGFGFCLEGASHVRIENVKMTDFTGDGIIISSSGGDDFIPSEHIVVRNCEIRRSRRNNISITGVDDVLVEDCNIENANGTQPELGIDIEGYSEGNNIYEKPVHVIIRNNLLKENSNGAVTNFNGKAVLIEGNHVDGTISYGYGTETVIANNTIIKNQKNEQTTGITGLGTSNLEDNNDVVIQGNIIIDFAKGIDIRGNSVLVSGNKIRNFERIGILAYQASQVNIEGNDIENGRPEKKKSIGFSIKQSDHITFSNNKITNVILAFRSRGQEIYMKGNVITQFSRGIWVSEGHAVVEGNHISPAAFHMVPESYSISVTNSASAVIQNNNISDFKNFPIYCTTDRQTKVINNVIEDSPLIVTIFLSYGTYEVIGNTISAVREKPSAAMIHLSQSTNSLIINNTLLNQFNKITAIHTKTATQTIIVGNTMINGTIQHHQTDVVKGNIET